MDSVTNAPPAMTVLADNRLPAEHACVGVNRNVIFDSGMALHARKLLAGTRRKSTQRYALVHLDVVADRGGFANDDARGVVDKEVFADRSAELMSTPVRPCAYSVIMRGISGTFCT